MRTEAEIRETLAALKARQLELRRAKHAIEAAMCATMVSTLSWVLKEISGPTIRVNVDE